MSGYSALFAEAFHPSASDSTKNPEKEKDDSQSSVGSAFESMGSESDTKSDPPPMNTTCDADVENAGKPHPDDDRLLLFHFDSTTSTQDEAKIIAKSLFESSSPSPESFCVTATTQSKGRGTTGRQWLGAPGNVFVTIGIPVDVMMTRMLRERKIPLTLLPLKVGDLTAALVRNELDTCGETAATVTVKWPNDVLVDDKKISGTLIENASDWFLIGVGINVAHAPTVPTTGTDYGRPSVSLSEYCGSGGSSSNSEEESRRGQTARDLGVRLALNFHRWIYEDTSTAESIVEGWKRWLDWDTELTMRNDGNSKVGPKRVVRLLDVLPDGRIRVKNAGDGKEEVLVSDYFV
jgi:BirA family biotin operon repressor/biotin-[acetyl-CoA-carboxylase] ligase